MFVCPASDCRSTFGNRSCLYYHKRFHHPNLIQKKFSRKVSPSAKTITCSECDWKTNRRDQLTVHSRKKHSPEYLVGRTVSRASSSQPVRVRLREARSRIKLAADVNVKGNGRWVVESNVDGSKLNHVRNMRDVGQSPDEDDGSLPVARESGFTRCKRVFQDLTRRLDSLPVGEDDSVYEQLCDWLDSCPLKKQRPDVIGAVGVHGLVQRLDKRDSREKATTDED